MPFQFNAPDLSQQSTWDSAQAPALIARPVATKPVWGGAPLLTTGQLAANKEAARIKTRDANMAAGIATGADLLLGLTSSYMQMNNAKQQRRAAENEAVRQEAQSRQDIQMAEMERKQARTRAMRVAQLNASQPQNAAAPSAAGGGTPKWLLPAAGAAAVGAAALMLMK